MGFGWRDPNILGERNYVKVIYFSRSTTRVYFGTGSFQRRTEIQEPIKLHSEEPVQTSLDSGI